MAKTIIIIEDIDTKTAQVSVQVLKFAKPGIDETDTPAILMSAAVESALTTHLTNYGTNAMFVPMQSTAQH
ncbi:MULTISPECIES: hypothetical protein [Methylobacter]